MARPEAELEPHGYTVEQFASSSLVRFADAGELIPEALEAKLPDSLDAPLRDAGQADWAAKVRRVEPLRK